LSLAPVHRTGGLALTLTVHPNFTPRGSVAKGSWAERCVVRETRVCGLRVEVKIKGVRGYVRG